MKQTRVIDYVVWRNDEDVLDGKTYVADEPRNAAKQAAAYDHAYRGGWEWRWPIDYVVRDPSTGKKYLVEVERESIPEFVAGKARAIK